MTFCLSLIFFFSPFFFYSRIWLMIVENYSFFQVDRNYHHNYELHRFFTLLLNDKPLSKFLLCKTLISGLQYDSVWRCDTTRPSSFVIAASQGFIDSRTLLLHSLPSWHHPHLFRFFNFEIHSALKQEIQGSWDTTLIVVSFVSRKEKIHHKKSMSASVVDANSPISHQCDVVKCPLFLTRF